MSSKLSNDISSTVNPPAIRGQTRDCLDPWFQPFIQPNGDVLPCCWFYQAALGNLHKAPFSEVINSAEFQQLRRELLTGELRKVCIECPSRAITTPENLLARLRAKMPR
jgi:radical SAM protein with 4Fe4S-binding SPASM domain